jgi:endonuclease/exonuclease/phosphatase family metal-dependent hydrolase
LRFRSSTHATVAVLGWLLAVLSFSTVVAAPVAAQVPPPTAAGLGVSVPYRTEPISPPTAEVTRADAGRTRQPVFVATTAADGSFLRGSDAITLTVDGAGASAIYADPFARTPIGTDTATLPAQEGFAVFYVAHDTPGPVAYVASLAAAPAVTASATGEVADDVADHERAATLSLEARVRPNGRYVVEVQPRDLQGVVLRGGVPVELHAVGTGAAALPGATAGVLPGAGTPSRVVTGTAIGGTLRVGLPAPVGEITLVAAVPAAYERPTLAWPVTGLRLPPSGGSTEPLVPTADGLTVATYNVHAGAPQGLPYEPTAAEGVLREMDADIALLQEVDDDRSRSNGDDLTARWATALGRTGVFAPNLVVAPQVPGTDAAWYGTAALVDGPVRAAANLALPRPLFPGRNTEPRGLLTVTVGTPTGDVRVANTHLGLNRGERLLSAHAIRTQLDGPGAPVSVVGGDLNSVPGTAEIDLLASPPLYDAWAAAGVGPGFTFSALTPTVRIDYLLPRSGLATIAIEVISSPASDHLPVLATFG